jgi:uncharacterized repeat protein (TIGR03803 family)
MKTIFYLIIIIIFSSVFLRGQVPTLFGMTQAGGSNSGGTIFSIDGNGLNDSIRFNFDMNGVTGSQPLDRLSFGSNGKFYGTTAVGGSFDQGVIFEFDFSNPAPFTKLFNFGNTIGNYPTGRLTELNGKLYGVTGSGGTNNKGTIYCYDIVNNVHTKLYDFKGFDDGEAPVGGLLLTSNGNFYGVTSYGGNFNYGTIYEYDLLNDTVLLLHNFNFQSGGAIRPTDALVEATNGKLYGCTQGGGSSYLGTIFNFDPSNNTYSQLFDFNNSTGGSPLGGLMLGNNGLFYGALNGGPTTDGTIFSFNPTTGVFTNEYNFSDIYGNGGGTLIQASDAKLYGMKGGGNMCTSSSSCGVLYRYDISLNQYNVLLYFDGSTGYEPALSLMEFPNLPSAVNKTEKDFDSFLLYPNPNSGNFELSVKKEVSNGEFLVFNVFGQIILREKIVKGVNRIESGSRVSSGLYNYSVSSEGKIIKVGKLTFD